MRKIIAALILILLCLIAVGCANDSVEPTDKSLTVTLLDGEHYSVVGDNKKTVEFGEGVKFEVALDRGYKVSGAFGDKCEVSDDLSFTQTVTFTDIKFKSTLRLETEEMGVSPFAVEIKDVEFGSVEISTVLGKAENGVYYTDDIMNVEAQAAEGYRFVCWSTESYLTDGGEFFGYENSLTEFDFTAVDKLYANFRDIANTGNMIFYQMDGGVEIEQDCTAVLEHHPRANTLTAPDMRSRGIDCDSRILVGWQTESGEFVGLGSRVAVSETRATVLSPVWKEYSDNSYFKINEWGGYPLTKILAFPRI